MSRATIRRWAVRTASVAVGSATLAAIGAGVASAAPPPAPNPFSNTSPDPGPLGNSTPAIYNLLGTWWWLGFVIAGAILVLGAIRIRTTRHQPNNWGEDQANSTIQSAVLKIALLAAIPAVFGAIIKIAQTFNA